MQRSGWLGLFLLLVAGLGLLLAEGRARVPEAPTPRPSGADTSRLQVSSEQAIAFEQDPNPDSGAWGIPLKDRASVTALRRWLADGHWSERCEAASLLGLLGSEASDAAQALAHALEDDSGCVRVESARALWRITGSPAQPVRALIECLERGDEITQVDAALTLGVMGDEAAGAASALVAVALGRDGPYAGTLDNYDPIGFHSCPAEGYVFISPAAAAARALGRIGVNNEEVADALKHLAAGGQDEERAWATEALAGQRSR
ncbi:MAG: hypothetical protein P1V36_16150 [Planctomycetota bacterium]|nr:hypothetical protein [Planctomycetota bacterium]